MSQAPRAPLFLLATLAVLLLFASGCGVEDDVPGGGIQFSHVAPEGPDGVELSEGARLETEVEAREALLVILKGVVTNSATAPYSAELVRAIDAPIFVDLDDESGHEHWITRAEVEDAEGNVLWATRTNSLFQLLEFLNLLLADQDFVEFTVPQVFYLVRLQYPELLEFAVRVPLGIPGAKDYVLRVPDAAGNVLEVARFDIEELVAGKQAPRFEGQVETIVETGPSSDRIEIAILGDGYTASERAKFELDAQAVAERMMGTSPFSEYSELFNIRTVWTPSVESGAGYDCRASQASCQNGFRDTVYRTTFVVPAIGDSFGLDVSDISDRVAMPLEIGKAFEVAALASFDEIIMISNSAKSSGFAGLYISLVTSFDDRSRFPDVAVHELGHSFGILGDEYMVAGDPCFFNEPRIPLPTNIATLSAGRVKWDHWIDTNPPMPTPPNFHADYPVGAYKGAYNCADLYRPSHECMMKSSGRDFCAVCTEQMVRRFYSVVDPTPQLPASVERVDSQTLRFQIPMWQDADNLLVTWTLDDEAISNDPNLDLTPASFDARTAPNTWVELTATVRDDSGFTRLDTADLVQSFKWWVKR